MAVAISLKLKEKLGQVVEKLKEKGEVVFTFFDSPKELEELLSLPRVAKPKKVFVSSDEAEGYLKLKEKYLPSEFFLFWRAESSRAVPISS